ncbi:MAG: hypothetical protein IJS99_06930 [Synergistaceae bacterium]|nr:hypothetical protein [Synergistaceae bacterium]
MNIIFKAARKVYILVTTYSCVIGSFLLGRCSFAKLRAFLKDYTRQEYGIRCRKLGIKLKERTHFNGKRILTTDEANIFIGEAIERGEPFMVGRYGSAEFSKIWRVRDDGKGFIAPIGLSKKDAAGFFPKDKQTIIKFAEIMKWATQYVDLQGIWNPMEEYMLKTYGKNPEYCNLGSIEPYFSKYPWSAKLEGKKVLVISPFVESIPYQYARRELIWPGKNILPKFELMVQRSIMILDDGKDSGFNDWFEALDFMYNEAMSKDFDIAILGCGPYGFPLAAKFKAAGKIAITFGGATQILFGIKGARWEQMDVFVKMFNENWIRPLEGKPKGYKKLDNGCYW